MQKDTLIRREEISSSDGKIEMKSVPTNYVEDMKDFKTRLGRTFKKQLLVLLLDISRQLLLLIAWHLVVKKNLKRKFRNRSRLWNKCINTIKCT